MSAQPFSNRLNNPTGHNYVAVLSPGAGFTFTNGFTFEAWVNIHDQAGNCSSIAGRAWQQAWWVGVCGTTMRSYLRGTGSLLDGGTIPADRWTHIAVTWDGTTHRHFIDGEEVAARAESGDIGSSATEVRIFSDTQWQFSPVGQIDEVRIWNVARSLTDIRSQITRTINTPVTGLVAVYHFDGNTNDAVGGHNGTNSGGLFAGPSATVCIPSSTTLCLENRYQLSVTWIAGDGSTGVGSVVPGFSSNSGLFWFFSADNWELLVKELNGCGLNSRRWVFSAATTNVHYQLSVLDTLTGEAKRYYNYQGVSAPAVTDTGAFLCP